MMLEAPEFGLNENENIKMSVKYDVWMMGIIIIQVFYLFILSFNDQDRLWYLTIKANRNFMRAQVRSYIR